MNRKKAGRPKTKFITNDILKSVEGLAQRFCSHEEVASAVDISARTLNRDEEYRKRYYKGQEKGKALLRSKMFELAQSGNVTMLIWMSKQWLDYAENPRDVRIKEKTYDLKKKELELKEKIYDDKDNESPFEIVLKRKDANEESVYID